MSTFRRFLPRPWVMAVFAAVALVVVTHRVRFDQAVRLTAVEEWSCDAPAVDPQSTTGLSGGTRSLVAPIHDPRSLETIAQAQSILAGGPWRVRTVDSDNTPVGRPTHATLPHRLWLAGLAWLDHVVSGRPAGLSVERAALLNDPIAHGLIVAGAGLLCGWRLGGLAAALVAFGAAAWFPAAAQFVAGAPSAWGLAWGCTLAGLLLLIVGAGFDTNRGACPWLVRWSGRGGRTRALD